MKVRSEVADTMEEELDAFALHVYGVEYERLSREQQQVVDTMVEAEERYAAA